MSEPTDELEPLEKLLKEGRIEELKEAITTLIITRDCYGRMLREKDVIIAKLELRLEKLKDDNEELIGAVKMILPYAWDEINSLENRILLGNEECKKDLERCKEAVSLAHGLIRELLEDE